MRLRSRRGCGCVVLLTLLALVAIGIVGTLTRPPAVSPPPSAPTPTPEQPTERHVLTYYYYWYDATTGAHLSEQSGLSQHFPADPPPTWRSPAWHLRQLQDMTYAGIDIVLPVYWGDDRPDDGWSSQGLGPLTDAWHTAAAAGANPPRIGLFLDTTIVAMRDLTTADGKDWLYGEVARYFQRIPRDEWASVDGGPPIFLFTSDFTAAMDQSTFDALSQRFQADFGVRPYIVREVSWDYPILRWDNGQRVLDTQQPIQTPSSYLWAAAVHGYVDRGGVAAVGPGYNDTHVPGRGAGTVRDRQGGAFYRGAFQAAIASGKPLLALETWNEFHEGSGIAESLEYGRQYLDLTRELSAAFRAH